MFVFPVFFSSTVRPLCPTCFFIFFYNEATHSFLALFRLNSGHYFAYECSYSSLSSSFQSSSFRD